MKVLQFTYTRVLAFIIMMMVGGNCWALSGDIVTDQSGNVTIDGDATIPEDKQVVIKGNLTINSGNTLSIKGNLIVEGNVVISGIVSMQNGVLRVGKFKQKDNGGYLLDKDGNYQWESGGDVTLNNGSKIVYSEGSSIIEVRKNLIGKEEAYIVSENGGSGDLIVSGTYTDLVKKASTYHPCWGLTITEKKVGWGTQIDGASFHDNDASDAIKLAASSYSMSEDGHVSGILGGILSLFGGKSITGSAKETIQNYVDTKTEVNAEIINGLISLVSSLLPISLTSFSASQNGDEIEIAWTTNSEVNNDYFTVEYSTNGVSFKTLEIVQGNGTTSEVNEYAITTEASRFNGVVYFRLKQTDYNGEYSYSDVITLMVESSKELYVYPNPATEFVSVSGTYKTAIVQDMFGKKVAVATNGEQIFVGNLSSGTYYVVVATENGRKVLPFVKE